MSTIPKSTSDALFSHLATVQLDADAAMGAYLNDPSELAEVTARATLIILADAFKRCTDAAASMSPGATLTLELIAAGKLSVCPNLECRSTFGVSAAGEPCEYCGQTLGLT